MGVINFENLDGSKSYHRWRAYSQSKLANLLFSYELQWRFVVAGIDAISVGVSPGLGSYQSAGCRPADGRLAHGRSPDLAGQPAVCAECGRGGTTDTYAATARASAAATISARLGWGCAVLPARSRPVLAPTMRQWLRGCGRCRRN